MEMEAASNSRGREGGEGEARRVNVVYFLSRNGRVEHPHLLRIRRLHRDRVRLRDVKRWLLEFRGNQVPDSFSWSYKRRYRGGYIWQDLRDDDLITPFSDDEYILKGSIDDLLKPAIVDGGAPPTSATPAAVDEPKQEEDGEQEDEKDENAASLASDSSNCSARVGQVLCNLLGCKTADDVLRPASHR